jgi:hypothetical protein
LIIPRVFGFIGRAHQTPWAGLLILAAIVWRAAPSAPFFAEIEERRRSDRMGGTEEPEPVASREA